MSKRHPSYKDRYNKDYVQDDLGSYLYTGDYYMYDLPAGKLKLLKFVYLIVPLVLLALFLAGGYVNNPGSRVIYVILPYITMFLPIAFMLSDAVKIIFSDNKMTFKQYNRSVLQLKRACIALMIISASAILGDAIYMGFRGGQSSALEMPYFLICFAIFSTGIIFHFVQRKAPCITIPK